MPNFSKLKIPAKFVNDRSFLEKIEEQFKSKLPKKVDTISPDEYEEKEDKAYIARIVLDEKERGKHLVLLINSEIRNAEQIILNNTIRDTVQEGFLNGIASKLSLSKKEQVEELKGGYKSLNKLKETLQFWVDDFYDLEKAIEDGKVIIENKDRNEIK